VIKVITYGSYDMLHYGHIRLLERAKALGDYLIVGVTSDDYDKTRGKINLKQSLMERLEAVKKTGIPDEVIVEEYEGQKIEDIKRYGIDIFTVGSDWEGFFDYLNEYCRVIYLPRTEGISSSEIRAEKRNTIIRLFGESAIGDKFKDESKYVNGIDIAYNDEANAAYIYTSPQMHYESVKKLLLDGRHVLCESPISINYEQCNELFEIADNNHLVLMEGIKTAYLTAFSRLVLIAKSGKIGEIISIDATCTSMRNLEVEAEKQWNSICAWGPTAMLPIFSILGCDFVSKTITSWIVDNSFDGFTKIDFLYKNAVASAKVAKGAKSEGELIITGTKGYIYVPAPWWKTDYFEIRYENPENNRRYYYQLDGQGIRYEIVAFARAIETGISDFYIDRNVSKTISRVINDFYSGKDLVLIRGSNHNKDEHK